MQKLELCRIEVLTKISQETQAVLSGTPFVEQFRLPAETQADFANERVSIHQERRVSDRI